MGIQHGLVKISGAVGNLSFYKMNGKYYVRLKTRHTKDRIHNDPAFARTLQNSLDFGKASRTSKALRAALRHIMASVSDTRMAGRFTGRLVRIMQTDTVHAAGERQIAHGKLTLLEGFEFNKHRAFHDVFDAPYHRSFSPDTHQAITRMGSWHTRDHIAPPAGATHARFISTMVTADFNNDRYAVHHVHSACLDLNEQVQPALELVNSWHPSPGATALVMLGVEFHQQVNGTMHLLANGGAMTVTKISAHEDISHTYPMFPVERQGGVKVDEGSKLTAQLSVEPRVEHQVGAKVNEVSTWTAPLTEERQTVAPIITHPADAVSLATRKFAHNKDPVCIT